MVIYTCESDFEAMMTCIYDAWASRLGYRNLRLLTEPVGNLELFCEYRHVEKNPQKAASVIRSIRQKISPEAYRMVYRCAMHFAPERLDHIYRFLLYGFSYGRRSLSMLQEPAVMTVFELNRKVANESHFFHEFLRFADIGGQLLVSHIEPKCDVLTLIAPHYADRLPSENWIIIDDSRKTAIVHPSDEPYYLTLLTEEELGKIREAEKKEDPYVTLWKGFFTSIAVDARKNPCCQRTHLPLWYRKNMTEFHAG